MERPWSNFDFVEVKFQGLVPLRRILSQVRQHDGKTIVIEKLKQSEELRQENEDIQLRYPGSSPVEAFRLSFFTKQLSNVRDISSLDQDDFMGYVITKKDYMPDCGEQVRVYESVIRPSRHVNNFIRGQSTWDCSVAGNIFKITGYLYAQQNGLTNVCAHVVLRTAASQFHKDRDMTYREMNQVVGIDHVNRKVGRGEPGLYPLEMCSILRAAGAWTHGVDYTTNVQEDDRPPPPFQKIVYGSVESGFPAIVMFETTDDPDVCHAIPVFGHTLNEDTWVCRAESSYFKVGAKTKYIPSESWVSSYIAHDDNFGLNYCIPRGYLHTRRDCTKLPERVCPVDSGCVVYVIGTFPQEVRTNAVEAEVIAADYLFKILEQLKDLAAPWRERLRAYATNGQLILRPLLITAHDYSEHISRVRDWSGKGLGFEMPAGGTQWLWMVEVSVPELFPANRRKVGEVVLDAEVEPRSQRHFGNFLFARLPGYFATYAGGTPEQPLYDFESCDLQTHVELHGCEEPS